MVQKSRRNVLVGLLGLSSVTATPCGLRANVQWRCCYFWWLPTHYNRKIFSRKIEHYGHLILTWLRRKKDNFSCCLKKITYKYVIRINTYLLKLSAMSHQGTNSGRRLILSHHSEMVYRTMTYELTDSLAKFVCHFCRPIFCISPLLQIRIQLIPCKQHDGRCTENNQQHTRVNVPTVNKK